MINIIVQCKDIRISKICIAFLENAFVSLNAIFAGYKQRTNECVVTWSDFDLTQLVSLWCDIIEF